MSGQSTLRWMALGGGIGWGRLCGDVGGIGSEEVCVADAELIVWLNVEGEGLIWGSRERFVMKPGMYALTGGRAVASWKHVRHAGRHRVECVKLGIAWIEDRFGRLGWVGNSGHLARRFFDGQSVAFCGLMGVWEKDLCGALEAAAGEGVSEGLLAEARILEWAANRLVRPLSAEADGLREREGPVGVALAHLRGHFAEPLNLDGLARLAGVSAPHLCRLVKMATGETLQRHLRRLRVEHACELLATGRANVTEAALDCGYQSLSHFAKAFRDETGMTPREWISRNQAKKGR